MKQKIGRENGEGQNARIPSKKRFYVTDNTWREMDVWATVDQQLERLHAADRFYEELLDLRHSLVTDPSQSAHQAVEAISKRLSEIVTDAKEKIR